MHLQPVARADADDSTGMHTFEDEIRPEFDLDTAVAERGVPPHFASQTSPGLKLSSDEIRV